MTSGVDSLGQVRHFLYSVFLYLPLTEHDHVKYFQNTSTGLCF